ncbi:MAG: hypothetical protein PSX36_02650 [bacterium]|nr:hypothetical protein [bacterium]
MKKLSYTLIAFSFLFTSFKLSAQKVELVPLCGYIFQSTYYGYDGRIVFSDGLAMGGMINFKPTKFLDIGLNILNQSTSANLIYSAASLGKNQTVDAGIINYQLSLVRNYIRAEGQKVVPFAGIDIGAIEYYGKNESSSSYVKMSIGFKGGVKIYLNEKLNIRLQPQLEMPISGVGLGIGIGTGGASVGVTTMSNFVQFGIIGGLGYTIIKKKQEPVPPVGQ